MKAEKTQGFDVVEALQLLPDESREDSGILTLLRSNIRKHNQIDPRTKNLETKRKNKRF
jgi:hypothetical protein